eukprot:g18660.t1
MRLLAAGVRERPLPLKLPMPAEVQFGKDSLASSPQAEKEIAWNLRKDSFKEDDETQDASSGGGSGFFDEVSTADAVDTADSTEERGAKPADKGCPGFVSVARVDGINGMMYPLALALANGAYVATEKLQSALGARLAPGFVPDARF